MVTLNACFISYMHSPVPGVQEIYKAFRDSLATQVGLYMPKVPVYLDTARLAGGDFFDQELPCQLCRSGCMVLLFNPSYFDTENTYCAREYRAMLKLEEKRLALADADLRKKGLIIPVVFRGEEALPDEIKSRRHCYSFDRMLLRPADFASEECTKIVREIADVVWQRFSAFKRLSANPPVPCETFALPADAEIQAWLRQVVDGVPTQKLPNT